MTFNQIERLRSEPPCRAQVEVRKGSPRLIVNDIAVNPLAAWSWGLVEAAPLFARCGVRILHPILGLNIAWPQPGAYDWSDYDELFDELLANHPDALFLPRVLLDVPEWWFDEYPGELVGAALPLESANKQYRNNILSPEGGMRWTNPLRAPSFASTRWLEDMEKILRAFLRHVESSQLRSRIIGYQIGAGVYGEWHYPLSEFMADTGDPARRAIGPIPSRDDRLRASFGLLRDPATEGDVIEFYRRFHEELCAPTLLRFAAITKEETDRRVLCGSFYGYLLENVWIQEGGHLAPELILASPDIDFLASPYTYQTTNIDGRPWWDHDVEDGAGNYLGRARGVAGDAGYRVLLESIRRHGKLYFAELDTATHLVAPAGSTDHVIDDMLANIGGEGTETRAGAIMALERDLGCAWASGATGWLFDFGPVMSLGKSWYDDPEIENVIRRFARLGEEREGMDLSSVAEIAAVYDPKAFFSTRHWRAEKPMGQGGAFDFFGQWFLDTQARAIHRIGAPVDFLYVDDVTAEDLQRYRLILMVNTFAMRDSYDLFVSKLADSSTTLVWFYAPGFVGGDEFEIERMQMLTGFDFDVLQSPGPMLIDCRLEGSGIRRFGVNEERHPRFVATGFDEDFGSWSDGAGVAFAERQMTGWKSVYVGTAPLPAGVLRELARRAGARLWSDHEDIVVATRDAATVVATSEGERKLSFPRPMQTLVPTLSGNDVSVMTEYGQVIVFSAS